ncbi:CUB domain-containing protein [Caenorhabditis elegans]|uniref:CUB domain-containing protein n=1 Tax=Caenorhabditis elegans TaxID=6239 RepID=Q5CZ40_CAEEL|nr:CUB domain-containing protein [Caenorhabditis elegans]CAI59116.1 CUB domain-containing protein [Caenorhabditis elegans]|eukprot:NP_001023287.1 Uncharacterized protein CELE_K08D8.4 [Caenorhabditis elegans]
MVSILFFLATLVASAFADGYTCANIMRNPTQNLSEPYYYPETWRENMEPTKYAPNQICNWQINVPEGLYATVIFYKKTDSESGIKCTYPNGEQVYIEDNDQNPYKFTYPRFQIDLQVGDKQGEFSFKVVWSEYPDGRSMYIGLDGVHSIASVPTSYYTTVTAVNQVMLVGFSVPDVPLALLRQSAIYEGGYTNGTYLGNLVNARSGQIYSTSNKLGVYTFGLEKFINQTVFMVLDSRAAGDIVQYTGTNCPTDPNKSCGIFLNSQKNVSAVATISRQPDYLTLPKGFANSITLKIYGETMEESNLFATINSNYQSMFPLRVTNSLKIYHSDTGLLTVPVAKNADAAKWNSVFDGRYIIVRSFDFNRQSYAQDTTETFVTDPNNQMYFKFNVKYLDTNGPTTLDVNVYKNGVAVFTATYTATNPPLPFPNGILGDKMEVNYQTYGNYTQGFQVDILTTKNDSPTTFPTLAPGASTTIGTGATRGTTQRYESTTKSGINKFSLTTLAIVGFVMLV